MVKFIMKCGSFFSTCITHVTAAEITKYITTPAIDPIIAAVIVVREDVYKTCDQCVSVLSHIQICRLVSPIQMFPTTICWKATVISITSCSRIWISICWGDYIIINDYTCRITPISSPIIESIILVWSSVSPHRVLNITSLSIDQS